jgi:hypothetical protein
MSTSNKIPQTLSQRIGTRFGIDPTSVVPLFAIVVLTLGIISYVVYSFHFPPERAESVEYTSLPLDIVHLESDVNTTKISRGYKVLTPNWSIVTDIRTSYDPKGTESGLSKNELMSSRNFAAICRLAKERNESVTFVGMPAKKSDGKPRMLDNKPVLVARKIMYGGEEIVLYAE